MGLQAYNTGNVLLLLPLHVAEVNQLVFCWLAGYFVGQSEIYQNIHIVFVNFENFFC